MPSLSREDWRGSLNASTATAVSSQASAAVPRVPGLTVLAHPDPRRIGARVALPALASGRAVPLSRLTPELSPPGGGEPLPLADPHLSRQALTLAPGPPGKEPGSLVLTHGVAGMAVEAGLTPVSGSRTFTAAEVERGVVLLLAGRVALLLHLQPPFPPAPTPEAGRFGLVGDGAAMAQLRAEIRRVADLAVPVLLRGETGTGKELVARAIQQAGDRRSGPYLAVNMAAIPPALAAAELFGAARGAFTGAEHRRLGYFSRAHGGTLFLDEIGETPPEVQVLLLRVLESREVQPVGAEAPQIVDVRVIAATDADLEAAIAAGRFRAPLLHRLNGYEIRIPALAERREDLGQLLFAFLQAELAAMGEEERLGDPGPRGTPWLPAPLVARLAAADWPGNVRQLKNVARQIAIASRGAAEAVLPPRLAPSLASTPEPGSAAVSIRREDASTPSPPRPTYRHPSEVSEEELLEALGRNRWRLSPTAAQLGVSRTSLYTLIDRCTRLKKAADLSAAEIGAALKRQRGDLDAAAEALQVSPHGLRLRVTELGLG